MARSDEEFAVDCPKQFHRKPVFHERPVGEGLGVAVGQGVSPFEFYGFPEGLPATLNPFNANRI